MLACSTQPGSSAERRPYVEASLMAVLPKAVERLIALFQRLPGIGERTATRLVFFVLAAQGDYANDLARALDGVTTDIGFCSQCHMISDGDRCPICLDPGRDDTLLCVVSTIQDLLAFERSGAYRGRYHVLHGVLSPLKGIGPDRLRIQNLRARISELGVKEVVIATSTAVEGEATALYLKRLLAEAPVRVSRIATGVPMGGDLEYVDPNTLSRALEGRTDLG